MKLRHAGSRSDRSPGPASGPAASVTVAPLIDVVLVLLIVFLVTVNVSRRTLPAALPKKSTAGEFLPQVVLELTLDGHNRINGQLVPDAQLPAVLTAVFRNRSPRILFIRMASERPHQDFIQAAEVARGAGVALVAEMGAD